MGWVVTKIHAFSHDSASASQYDENNNLAEYTQIRIINNRAIDAVLSCHLFI